MIAKYKSKRFIIVLLFSLATTSVLPTLWGPFIFDDVEAIVNNEDVTGLNTRTGKHNPITDIFFHDFWGSSIKHPNSHKSYRPLTTLTFRTDYKLWGLNPLPYRITNWLIHGINTILVFHFLLLLLHPSNIPKFYSEFGQYPFKDICLWASIIFAVHPIHVEPLGGVVGRADLLGALFFLLGGILVTNLSQSPWSSIGISIIGVIGSLFKENVIVIVMLQPFLLLIQGRISFRKCSHFVISGATTIFFITWRLWFQDGLPVFENYDNPPVFAKDFFTRVSSVIYIWLLNIWILINPTWLCFDWSMNCISLIEKPTDPRFFLVVSFPLVLCWTLISTIRCKLWVVAIGLLIGIITFLPLSNILVTVGFVIAERNLYLSSIGFSLIITYAMMSLPIGKFLLMFIAGVFYVRSIQRSFDWTNQERLFISAVSVCPNNGKVHYNVGTVYGELGKVESAIKYYSKAIELKPDYHQAMNNLGNILRVNNRFDEAEYWLRKAVSNKHDFAAAWMNLGIVMSRKNRTEALQLYHNALKYRKIYPDCEYNLGNLFLEMGENELALKAWLRTIHLKPSHLQSWLNILILLEQKNELHQARTYGLLALNALGDEQDVLHFLLGNIHGRLEEFGLAEAHFQKAISLCQNFKKSVPIKHWSNLGVLYHRWGKYADARRAYGEALRINPDMETVKRHLSALSKNEKSRFKI